ncbi:LLM class flavin-dependent oxidoreductase [Micromonospora echinospora]|uniref:LLM class flavin-dependent oxidoreductase n=1 Tax=Micromonospora echinospora TaxID=1877 RepID=UPI0033DCC259
MDIGVSILPLGPWTSLRRRWQWAEEHGAAHAWTFDHLVWRALPRHPWLGAVPVLAAVAGVTDRMRLGTLVSSPNFRAPVPFAKEVVSLDHICGGRLVVGVGAGAGGFDAAQQPAAGPGRYDRFADFLGHLHDLLGPERAARPGGVMEPGPVQPRLPLAVAATRSRGLRLAARHGDYWVTNGYSPAPGHRGPTLSVREVRDQVATLDRHCADLGRDPATLRRLLVVGNPVETPVEDVDSVHRLLDAYGELGFTDIVLPYPLADDPHGLAVLAEVLVGHRGHPGTGHPDAPPPAEKTA